MTLLARIVGATSVVAIASVFARALSILSAPVLTAQLGPEPYGEMALLATLISLGAIVGICGIDFSYTRYACSGTHEDALAERYCWGFSYKSALLAAFLLLLVSSLWLVQTTQLPLLLFCFAALGVVFSVLEKMAQARKRLQHSYRLIAVSISISALISITITVFLAVNWRQDIWPLLIGALLAPFINLCVLGIYLPKNPKSESKISKVKKREILKFGITGSALSAPLYWIITSSDRWFIGAYLDHNYVGIYSFTYNIAIVGLMLNTSLLTAWRTEAARDFGNTVNEQSSIILGKLWEGFVFVMAVVWLSVVAAGGDIIRLLADESFHEGIAILPFIAGGVFFYGISHLSSISMVIKKNMLPRVGIYFVSAIFCVVLNYFAIPIFGIVGAACVQLVAFFIAAILVHVAGNRYLKLRIRMSRIILMLFVVVVAGVILFPPWFDAPILSLAVKLPVGILISSLIASIFLPESWSQGVAYIKTKTKTKTKTKMPKAG